MTTPRRRRHIRGWLIAIAFSVLFASADAFGGTFLPLIVALIFATLLWLADEHSGNNTPAIRRAKRKTRA